MRDALHIYIYAHRLRVPKKLFVQIYSSVFFGGLQIEKKIHFFLRRIEFSKPFAILSLHMTNIFAEVRVRHIE